RSYGDWSSDVCSSDLPLPSCRLLLLGSESNSGEIQGFIFLRIVSSPCVNQVGSPHESKIVRSSRNIIQNSRDYARWSIFWGDTRSEERRVGKECRCGW